MNMRRCALALIVGTVSLAATTGRADVLRVYFVGNSVTDTINYDGLTNMAAQGGHTQIWARQMIPGAPLSWLWEHPADGFKTDPYGYPTNAFPNYTWDAISLQPFDRHLTGSDGDIQESHNFIDLALQNPANKATQFYVYERWPRRETDGTLDYAARWNQTYTGGWDSTNETRDYFEQLTTQLRTDYAGVLEKPILLVPVGDVLYDLNTQIKNGAVPGISDITDFYADGIHFNNMGQFIVGTTFYATLYKSDPRGLAVPSQYGTIDPALVALIQDTVWNVATSNPLSGVTDPVPEPASLALLGLGAMALLRRRRA